MNVIKKLILFLREHISVVITLLILNVIILSIAHISALILREEVYKSNIRLGESKCADAVNHLDRIVYTGENIVNFVAQDIHYFRDVAKDADLYQNLLRDTFKMINKNSNYFINLYVALQGKIIHTAEDKNQILSPVGRIWYEEALKRDRMFISNPYIDMISGKAAITISRRVVNSNNVIGLDIAQEKIKSIIEQEVKENENIVSGLIVNEDTVVIGQAGDKYKELSQKREDGQMYLSSYTSKIMPSESGHILLEYKGEEYALVHQKTSSDWHVIYLIDKEWMSQETQTFKNGLVIMFVICLSLLNIIVILYYNKRMKALKLMERAEKAEKEVSLYNERLEEQVQEKTYAIRKQEFKLQKLNESILDNLADIVEFRDIESGQHIKRIKNYTYCLAKKIQELHPEYNISNDNIERIYQAAALHDIGKIGIPDSILLKPTKLTNEEFQTMKLHTVIGDDIVTRILKNYDTELMIYGHEICRYHHERYDGKGYPEGLKGDEIPISAQIVGVADVYDALITKRVYKDAYSHVIAVNMIKNGECGSFSEKLLNCLELVEIDFENISKKYQ